MGSNGGPSQAGSVNIFCQTLNTLGVQRGIDIDVGCGQFTTKFRESQNEQPSQQLTVNELRDFIPQTPVVGVNDNNDDTVSNDDREDCNDALSMTVDLDNNNPLAGVSMTRLNGFPQMWW